MKSTKTVHPTQEELTAFGQGRLPPDRHAAVEQHVACCDACCDVLRRLPEDTLVGALRKETSCDVPVPPPLAPGADVPPELANHPRYRIIKALGAGGMGIVYQAEHRVMARTVALKVINREFVAHPVAVERFRQEVRAAARLAHPNIVAAHDAEQAGSLHFLVMEFVEGITLARLVAKRGPLLPGQACPLIRQAALGLKHAHEQGMVHRDIKPQNLMLTRKGQLKILDFGLARFARTSAPPSATNATLTQVGTVVGTPDYMAPEQAMDSRAVDIRADIYSLGCTLFFLLSGRVPFPSDSVVDKLLSRQTANPADQLRGQIPAGLADVLSRMTAADPRERFTTPAEVARALASLPRDTTEPTLTLPSPVSRETSPSRGSYRGVKILGATLALLLALGGAVGGVIIWKNRSATDGREPVADTRPPERQPPPASPVVPNPARQSHVLMLLPAQDFWYADYAPVRRVLERGGVRVSVASSETLCRHDPAGAGEDVRADVLLDDCKAEAFDALVLAGGRGVRAYLNAGPHGKTAQKLAQAMRDAGKPVAALCMATGVLADARILKGKRAIGPAMTRPVIEKEGGTWTDAAVVEDGQVITGRDPQAAEAFAEAVLRHLTKPASP